MPWLPLFRCRCKLPKPPNPPGFAPLDSASGRTLALCQCSPLDRHGKAAAARHWCSKQPTPPMQGGPCGMLRVTSCIGSRFWLPPCRPAYQRIQDESRRYCVRPCHCSIDKALSSMVPRWLEQRLTATLPLPLRPLSAVVPRRCRSPKLLRALSEHLPTPMAAERADDAEQCPRRCRCNDTVTTRPGHEIVLRFR